MTVQPRLNGKGKYLLLFRYFPFIIICIVYPTPRRGNSQTTSRRLMLSPAHRRLFPLNRGIVGVCIPQKMRGTWHAQIFYRNRSFYLPLWAKKIFPLAVRTNMRQGKRGLFSRPVRFLFYEFFIVCFIVCFVKILFQNTMPATTELLLGVSLCPPGSAFFFVCPAESQDSPILPDSYPWSRQYDSPRHKYEDIDWFFLAGTQFLGLGIYKMW